MKRTLDPTKHFHMNQGVSRFSKSWAWVGRIFIPKEIACRSVNGKLEHATVAALYSFFKIHNPGATLVVDNYENDRHNSIGCLGVKPMDLYQFSEMMDHLRTHVMLPTHQLRVNLEQEQREHIHWYFKKEFDLFTPMLAEEPIETFVSIYADVLEQIVANSHMYNAEGILGSAGHLDVKPEVVLARENEVQRRQSGGNDLKENTPENRTWVNSVMGFLHG